MYMYKYLSKVPGLLFNTPDTCFVYIRLISDVRIKIFIKPNKYIIEDPKFQKDVPNTSKVIYAWHKINYGRLTQ